MTKLSSFIVLFVVMSVMIYWFPLFSQNINLSKMDRG